MSHEISREELAEAMKRGAELFRAARPKDLASGQDALISRMGLAFAYAMSLRQSDPEFRRAAAIEALEALDIAWEIIDSHADEIGEVH